MNSNPRLSSLFARRLRLLACLGALAALPHASAATWLQWGSDGQGGSGIWDVDFANWWDGSAATTWQPGGYATFAGPGGTVVVDGPEVMGIQFAAGEYHLAAGNFIATSYPLFVRTNTEGWIDDVIISWTTTGRVISKTGPAVLNLGPVRDHADLLLINVGPVRLLPSSGNGPVIRFSDQENTEMLLAAPADTIRLGGLTGGVPGTIIRPDAGSPATLALTSTSNGFVFDGRLEDGPNGEILSLRHESSRVQTLRGANTYSGDTVIDAGTIELSRAGALQNSEAKVSATLILNNSETALPGRLSAGKGVMISGGTLQIAGNPIATVTENISTLGFSQTARLTLDPINGVPVTLQASELIRQDAGILLVNGSGTFALPNLPAGQFLGPHVLRDGSHWGFVGENGEVLSFTDYTNSLEEVGPDDHVDLTGMLIPSIAESTTVASIRAHSPADPTSVLLADDAELRVETGALLFTGGGTWTISGGSLVSGTDELVVFSDQSVIIDSTIADKTPGVSLVKAGDGRLELIGNNTFTGNIHVIDGILTADSDSALGMGEEIFLDRGALVFPNALSSDKSLVVARSGTLHSLGGVVEFNSIQNNGSFILGGTGSLRLTESGIHLGTMTLNRGSISAAGVQGGYMRLLASSRAEIDGRLERLFFGWASRPSVISISGSSPGVLEIDHFSGQSRGIPGLTLELNLDPAGSDLLKINSMTRDGTTPAVAVHPLDLHLLEVGGIYKFAEILDAAADRENLFILDSDLYAEGWRAAIVEDGNSVYLKLLATPNTELSLQDALGIPGLVWSTGGTREWRGDPFGYDFETHAANSGELATGEENWLETTIVGPGTLSFEMRANTSAKVAVGDRWPTTLYMYNSSRWESFQITIPTGPQNVRWSTGTLGGRFSLANLAFDPASYEAWSHWSGIPESLAAPEQDADGDGIANILHYALGISATENARGKLPQISTQHIDEADFLTLTYERRVPLADVLLQVEGSHDLQNWIPLATFETVESLGDNMQRVTVRDSGPLPENGRRFLRLQAIQIN